MPMRQECQLVGKFKRRFKLLFAQYFLRIFAAILLGSSFCFFDFFNYRGIVFYRTD
jgi:hypothetical protein